ncbi:MAG TPA: ABC transporter substrate-binding protein [Solirubrobacteraceae bacterium]|nr:ABC transporter substrate-binding protein [Solirubrobacteraceae bacterium]
MIAVVVAIVGAAWGAAGASAAMKQPHKSAFKGSVKIGLVSDFTGDLEVASNMQGALAFIDYVNATGGVDGYKLVAKEFDAQSSPTTAVQAVRQAVAYKPAGIIGASFVMSTALPTLAESGIPSVGDGFVGGWTGHKNLFPVDGDQATHESTVSAIVAKDFGKSTKIAFIGSAIDASQQKVLVNHAASAGVNFVLKDFTEQLVPTSPEYLSMAEKIKASGAGAVVDFGIEDMAALQTDLNQLGASNVHVVGTDIPPATTGANGLLFGLPWASAYVKGDPGITAYVAAMKKNGYRKDIATAAYAPFRWAQVALLVQGLEAAGPPFSHAAVIKALSHVQDFTANGIIAPASFPSYQTVGGHCDSVGEIVNGKWKALTNGKNPFVCGGTSYGIG